VLGVTWEEEEIKVQHRNHFVVPGVSWILVRVIPAYILIVIHKCT
jgi:hypothetical protein